MWLVYGKETKGVELSSDRNGVEWNCLVTGIEWIGSVNLNGAERTRYGMSYRPVPYTPPKLPHPLFKMAAIDKLR